VELSARDDAIGLFGPGSMAWRVDRELVVLAGGSCALLMQAAHPVVAAGVLQHSTYATDPFGRLMRTLESSFDVVFGTRSRAEETLRRVNAIHGRVRGRRPDDGTSYQALDPEALLWVHATLVDTALRVYGRFVGPLTPAEQQAYHEEAATVALRLGIPPERLPPTIEGLRDWMTGMLADGSVHVTPGAREIARTVLAPVAWVPRPLWEIAHLISISSLPPILRQQYGLRWSARRDRGMDRIAAATRSILPVLPPALRVAPAALAAERRVRATAPRRAMATPR
jgi:uncharacterized protein (DUF2236 family)